MSLAVKNLSPTESGSGPSKTRLTRVLIATDDPAESRSILTELRGLDLDVQLCLFEDGRLSSVPTRAPDAILCHFTQDDTSAKKVATVLKAQFAVRNPPVIGVLTATDAEPDPAFDSQLFTPAHPSQIANRVNAMIRLGAMESEIQRRLLTLREHFGAEPELSEISTKRRFRVLFIGKAAPAFMVVINVLQDHNVDVVAAFTSFSAFDYLHGEPFDAVVMNALEQSEPALTISETMRRNAKLFHVPTLFLVQDDFRDREIAYAKGARDIIHINAPAEEIRGRILELANYHRIHEQLKTDILGLAGDVARDASGTVFSSAFLDAHLPRLVDHAHTTQQPLCLMAVKFEPDTDHKISSEGLEHALVQTGGLIQSLVRMQDVVARVSQNIFLLAFNDTDLATGRTILDRIERIMGETSHDADLQRSSQFTFKLNGAVKQIADDDTAQKLLERTLLSVLSPA